MQGSGLCLCFGFPSSLVWLILEYSAPPQFVIAKFHCNCQSHLPSFWCHSWPPSSFSPFPSISSSKPAWLARAPEGAREGPLSSLGLPQPMLSQGS